jgi:DNA-binding transcriptional MerR regulator
MSNRILTLFGEEETQPEQMKAVGRSRAKKKSDEAQGTEKSDNEEDANKSAAAEKIEEAEVVGQPENGAVSEQEEKKDDKKFELPEDWKGDKNYYSIGEVATLFRVKTSHIRFWTNEFKLKVRTTRKGDRLYTPEQVRELKAIHHLVKERGFKLSGAKAKLKTQNNRDVETIDLKHALLQLRNKLVIIKNQLSVQGGEGKI